MIGAGVKLTDSKLKQIVKPIETHLIHTLYNSWKNYNTEKAHFKSIIRQLYKFTNVQRSVKTICPEQPSNE
jgi:hypothetical protein